MDDIDLAQAADELHRTAALSRRQQPQPTIRPTTPDCDLCGDPITEARRTALPHTTLCADCAAEAEALARRTRRVGGG